MTSCDVPGARKSAKLKGKFEVVVMEEEVRRKVGSGVRPFNYDKLARWLLSH